MCVCVSVNVVQYVNRVKKYVTSCSVRVSICNCTYVHRYGVPAYF